MVEKVNNGLCQWEQDVKDFHKKFELVCLDKPCNTDKKTENLRIALIVEETNELFLAMRRKDLAEIADGGVDAIYVIIGTLLSYGISITPVWDMIHKTNMAKEGGGTRRDGKVLKPKDWKAPDVRSEIIRQIET